MSNSSLSKLVLIAATLGLFLHQPAPAQWRHVDDDDDEEEQDDRRLPRDRDTVSMPDRAKDYAVAMQQFKNLQEDRDRIWLQAQALRKQLDQEMAASPERLRVRAGISETREAYYTERDRVIAKLRSEPEYREAREKTTQIDAQIQKLHAEADDDNRIEIRDLANERMRWGDRITVMEEKALEKAGVGKLREAWIEARAKSDKLVKEQQAQVDKNPELAALYGRLEDLRGDVNAARVTLAGAQAAYRQAESDLYVNDEYRRRYYYLFYPYRDVYRVSSPFWFPTSFQFRTTFPFYGHTPIYPFH